MSVPSTSTMKSAIHKRLYTVLPRTRVRSNSATSVSSNRGLHTGSLPFFDSSSGLPPALPPNGRGARLSAEVEIHTTHTPSSPVHSQHHHHGAHPPFSLALTGAPPSYPAVSPYGSSAGPFVPYASFKDGAAADGVVGGAIEGQPAAKRQRTRYRLDVGAYGIPKKARGKHHARKAGMGSVGGAEDEWGLAVQVGEDAYFVRDNAMGVADGVGGWSRIQKESGGYRPQEASASALFAKRLMHYCSAEVDASRPPPPVDVTPRTAPIDIPHSYRHPTSAFDLEEAAEEDEGWEEEHEMEDLAAGLDVLMILERAYEKTLRAHVVPAAPSPAGGYPPQPYPPVVPPPPPPPAKLETSRPPSPSAMRPASPISISLSHSAPQTVPLMAGSSTALVAVLEPSVARAEAAAEGAGDAVLRIAHLGDSMGMLVRADEVVWRSEEMWSNWNTPLQLGPASATTPADAHVVALRVRADDVLIIASDGMSDNLWDAEVLDEVRRFRARFLGGGVIGRRGMAGMLSEALCERARRVSERRVGGEVPFAARAREMGRAFRGGKSDDISVCVAVISGAGVET